MAYADDLAAAVQVLRASALGGTSAAEAVVRRVPDDQLRAALVQLAWLATRVCPSSPLPWTCSTVDVIEAEVGWLLSPGR